MSESRESWVQFSENDIERLIESYISSLSRYLGSAYLSDMVVEDVESYTNRIQELIKVKKRFKEEN